MFYDFVNAAVRIILAIFTRSRVEGIHNIPSTGPFILVSNHINFIDPPVLGALLPRRIHFMAKEELFRAPLVGWVVKGYGAFPVRRGQADRQALRTATDLLRGEGVIGIFPEGTRSKTGSMAAAHSGAAMVALLTGASVVPVGIMGTDRARTPLHFLFLRPRITLRVGEPFVLEKSGSRKDGLEEATTRMMRHVALLLPQERRGVYSDACQDQPDPPGDHEGSRAPA